MLQYEIVPWYRLSHAGLHVHLVVLHDIKHERWGALKGLQRESKTTWADQSVINATRDGFKNS